MDTITEIVADVVLNVVQLRRVFCSTVDNEIAAAVAALAEEGISLSPAEVEGQAQFIRLSSQKSCFFCNAPNTHQTGWAEMSWAELGHVLCPCLAQYRSTRRVYFPKWEKRLPELVERVHKGLLPEGTVLYTDLCAEPACRKPFKVTARNAVIGYTKNGAFSGWARCYDCIQKKKPAAKPQAKKPVAVAPAAPAPTFVTARRAVKKNALANDGEFAKQLADMVGNLDKLLKKGTG